MHRRGSSAAAGPPGVLTSAVNHVLSPIMKAFLNCWRMHALHFIHVGILVGGQASLTNTCNLHISTIRRLGRRQKLTCLHLLWRQLER